MVIDLIDVHSKKTNKNKNKQILKGKRQKYVTNKN